MNNNLKKITAFLLTLIVTVAFIGCDNVTTSTTVDTTGVTTETTTRLTTQGETTLTTQGETTLTTQETTVTTTGETTVTTIVTTTETTTTEVTTTEATTTEATTTEVATTEVTTTESTTTETTTTEGTISLQVIVTNADYTLGDSFDEDSILVNLIRPNGTAIPLNSTNYTVSGFDSTVAGTITITVAYYDYTTTFDVNIADPIDGLVITMEYYFDAQGLSGSGLFDELQTIVNNGFQGVTYGEARYILDETDADPTNSNNLILVYLATSISNVWDYGVTWNREHVWPQSLLPGEAKNSVVNTCSDLQNLKPSNPSENSSRSNRYYDNVSVGGLSYEPRDEVKGDVARILLYMITMYNELSLVNSTPGYLEMGLFDVLLEWHELDPVDAFERNRNDIIYSYQHNRNPYIDYPEFVEIIWG